MKRGIFVAAVVLLAVLFAGCEFIESPEGGLEKPVLVYDDNGQAVAVELDVKITEASGRALTKPLAQAGVNYYEVIFAYDADGGGSDPEVLIRRSWRAGGQARVSVPFNNYNNAGDYKAYLFAGRYDTRTLLAVGVIDDVEDLGTSTGTKVIGADTTSVIFGLTALQTDIAGASAVPPRTPTFIASVGGGPPLNVATDKVRIDDNPIPIAMFPINEDVDVLFGITGINITTAGEHYQSIVVTGTPTLSTKGFIIEGDVPLASLVLQTDTPTPAVYSEFNNNTGGTVATPIALVLPIDMKLRTPNKNGLGIFYFQIPVMMYASTHFPSTEPAPVQWYIRGGINNQIIDAGADHNYGDGSIGGAVLYGVGNVLDGSGFIVIPQPRP